MFPLASISGNVKGDIFNNDVGDVNLAGVHIKLLDTSSVVIATNVTDVSCNYVFYDLPKSSYDVMETNIDDFPINARRN